MYVVWLYCSNRFPIGIQSQTVAQLIDCCHSFSFPVYAMCYECERKYPHKTLTHTHTQAVTHIYALTMVNAVCVLACSPHHSNNSNNNNNSSNTRWSGSLVKYLQNFVKGPAALISSRAVRLFVQSLSLSPTVVQLSGCPLWLANWNQQQLQPPPATTTITRATEIVTFNLRFLHSFCVVVAAFCQLLIAFCGVFCSHFVVAFISMSLLFLFCSSPSPFAQVP